MARRAGVAPQAAGRRMRLGPPAAALALGGLVLVLAVAAKPLARLAHQSLNAASASVPVWVEVPLAVGADLASSVQQALEPAHVSVWIRQPDGSDAEPAS